MLRRRRRPDVDGREDRAPHQRDARGTGACTLAPAIIATACPYCSVMMGDGLATAGKATSIATRDLAELVAEAMVRA